jgi:hypothetical protein
MKSEIAMQSWTQRILSFAVLAVIMTLAWYSSSGQPVDPDDAPWRWSQDAQPVGWLDHRQRLEPGQDEIASMPTYREMRRALTYLDSARSALLIQAAKGDSQEASEAVREYQRTMEVVQTRVKQLRSRLTSEEYARFWSLVVQDLNEDATDCEEPLEEWRLGILEIRGET